MALNKSFIPRRNHGICSKHFIKESYVKIGGSFVLRKNAIPWYIQSPQNTYKQGNYNLLINTIHIFFLSIM